MNVQRQPARGKAWIAAGLACAAAGCRSIPAESPVILCGTVARAQAGRDYVIVESERPCPSGLLLAVRRGTNTVGQVRTGGWRQGKYQAADVVSGDPAEGDWFRETIQVPREKP